MNINNWPRHEVVLAVASLLALGSGAAYATEDYGEKPPPHFKCYQLGEAGGALNEPVTLTDQFHKEYVEVKNPHFLCGPVVKKHCTHYYGKKKCYISEADLEGWHLLCWKIAPSGPPVGEKVTARESQFEERTVKVQTGQLLCEPVKKERKKKY
ncbi:MAG: hypothetical protein ACREXS_12515 [Gammaproteobacteria bacterium]